MDKDTKKSFRARRVQKSPLAKPTNELQLPFYAASSSLTENVTCSQFTLYEQIELPLQFPGTVVA